MLYTGKIGEYGVSLCVYYIELAHAQDFRQINEGMCLNTEIENDCINILYSRNRLQAIICVNLKYITSAKCLGYIYIICVYVYVYYGKENDCINIGKCAGIMVN